VREARAPETIQKHTETGVEGQKAGSGPLRLRRQQGVSGYDGKGGCVGDRNKVRRNLANVVVSVGTHNVCGIEPNLFSGKHETL